MTLKVTKNSSALLFWILLKRNMLVERNTLKATYTNLMIMSMIKTISIIVVVIIIIIIILISVNLRQNSPYRKHTQIGHIRKTEYYLIPWGRIKKIVNREISCLEKRSHWLRECWLYHRTYRKKSLSGCSLSYNNSILLIRPVYAVG